MGTGKKLDGNGKGQLGPARGNQGKIYLENHAGGDNWSNSELHQCSSVTGQHHAQPVQGVRGIGRHNAIKRHLAHDQEDKESQLITI